MPEPTKAAIAVPSRDPKKKEDDEKNVLLPRRSPMRKKGRSWYVAGA
jgi:hypothetical protein